MPDNKDITHPLDAKRIDINDPAEVRNWCKSFNNCTEEQLKKAVEAVGTSGAAVRKYLENQSNPALNPTALRASG